MVSRWQPQWRSFVAPVGFERVYIPLDGIPSFSVRGLGRAVPPLRALVLLRRRELQDLVLAVGLALDEVVLLVHDHLLLLPDVAYDVHLVRPWPQLRLLSMLLIHKAELLPLIKHLLPLLGFLHFGLLKDVVVLGADLVLEELLVRALVLQEHQVGLFLLLRELQLVLLLFQALELHFQPLSLVKEADSTALLELFGIELWQVVHEAVFIGDHLLLEQLLGLSLWWGLISLLEDVMLS